MKQTTTPDLTLFIIIGIFIATASLIIVFDIKKLLKDKKEFKRTMIAVAVGIVISIIIIFIQHYFGYHLAWGNLTVYLTIIYSIRLSINSCPPPPACWTTAQSRHE